MIESVVKIGGSLGRGDKLKALCRRLAELGRSHSMLVVPGGGAFADTVRYYDNRFRLGQSASHWMAILSIDQFGYLISELIPDSEPVRSLVSARRIIAAGKVPVLIPFDLLWRADPLPHSWRVTSDSIAAWVAELARAPMLVLLKDVDGLYSNDPHGDGHGFLWEEIRLKRLSVCEGVDPCLASLLSTNALELWIINGEKPERLANLMEKGHTKGTHLKR
jgi:hypothetical protein